MNSGLLRLSAELAMSQASTAEAAAAAYMLQVGYTNSTPLLAVDLTHTQAGTKPYPHRGYLQP